jgi:hypothetical protein
VAFGEPPGRMIWRSPRLLSNAVVSDWLAHPLVLLVAGAVISSVVVPRLTSRWQNHQKALELKTDLVSEIAKAVTSLVIAVQAAEVGSKSQSQEEFDKAYRAWETDWAVIASKLRAYFPKADLVRQWNDVARLTSTFYMLTGMGNRKAELLQDLLNEARSQRPALDSDAAAELKLFEKLGVKGYQLAWTELKAYVFAGRDAVIRGVLGARRSAI